MLNGVKRWITNAGVSQFYTVMAVTDPGAGPRGISAFVVENADAGVSFGAPERKLGIKGSPTAEIYFDDVRIPADRIIGEEGTGFTTALRTLDHTRLDDRRAGGRHRAGRARLLHAATSRSASSSARRSRSSRACSSCSPTWR